jgi:hypothetical protein
MGLEPMHLSIVGLESAASDHSAIVPVTKRISMRDPWTVHIICEIVINDHGAPQVDVIVTMDRTHMGSEYNPGMAFLEERWLEIPPRW